MREEVLNVLKLSVMMMIAVFVLTAHYSLVQSYTFKGAQDAGKILSQFFKDAAGFKPVIGEGEKVLYYEVYTQEGKMLGYGFIMGFRGMWNEIKLAGALDPDYKLLGIKVLEQGETPGLGARIEEEEFEQQFSGLTIEDIKLSKFGGKIDAISGATTTSKIVTEAIRKEAEKIRLNASRMQSAEVR